MMKRLATFTLVSLFIVFGFPKSGHCQSSVWETYFSSAQAALKRSDRDTYKQFMTLAASEAERFEKPDLRAAYTYATLALTLAKNEPAKAKLRAAQAIKEMDALEALPDIGPKSPLFRALVFDFCGRLYLGWNDLAKSEAAFRRAISQIEHASKGSSQLYKMAYGRGEAEDVLISYLGDPGGQEKPLMGWNLYHLGVIRLQQKRNSEADALFGQALRIFEDDSTKQWRQDRADILASIPRQYMKHSVLSKAREHYEAIAALYNAKKGFGGEDGVVLLTDTADFFSAQNDPVKADLLYEEAILILAGLGGEHTEQMLELLRKRLHILTGDDNQAARAEVEEQLRSLKTPADNADPAPIPQMGLNQPGE